MCTYLRNLTVFIALVLLSCSRNADGACGYKSCPARKANMVNVHLVPHSHDDVGWLKTVDQYYYGNKNNIQHAGVQYILDSVVTELLKDTSRRFIYVESAFFFKWYNEQTAATQKNVKTLINDGRLEIAGGAWSMNDEAAVHYQSTIDQFSLGLKNLETTFGSCARPRVGWQIDPFGHSREMASIFAQMGYDGEFFARIDWVDRNDRILNLTAEMIWKASEDLGVSSEIFAGLLYNHYSSPPGFCFDNLCSDEPIIDGNSYDNNVKTKVDDFITYINKLGKYYRASDLLVPMGDDFFYENANMNFKNMDKLIKYVNERQLQGTKLNIFYSTPSCYLNAIHEQKLTWPSKTQDFFPYSTDWHTYWTGYYSSRPTQKRFERDGNHFLQVTKQLTTFANLTGTTYDGNLDKLRQVMGIMQHHDAITGTEKQRVAYDYDRLLNEALVGAQTNARVALQKITGRTSGEFKSCMNLNISMCEFTRTSANGLVVTLFNPLAHPGWQIVRVPVPNHKYYVVNEKGNVIVSQIVPVPKELIALEFRPNYTQQEIVFNAHVDKLDNYYIKLSERDTKTKSKYRSMPQRFQQLREEPSVAEESDVLIPEPRAANDILVQTNLIKLNFSASTGHLTSVQMNGITENIRQDFFYYRSALGNNAEFKNRSSGAYIFRPNGTEVTVSTKVDITVYNGSVVKEVHQRFNNWISQVVRIYEGVNRVEFEWLVGPIPVQDGVGKEVITRFTSSIANKGIFWTDSNGREMLRRERNKREYFTANMTESVSGNYYPIAARLALEDTTKHMTLLNDRSQGGSSVKDGQLELMLHRRTLHDDAFGVGEPLNETAYGKGLVARGKVYLILRPTKDRVGDRSAQQEIHLPFWKFFSNATQAVSGKPVALPNFTTSLPGTVQLLTLEPYTAKERLLRLENYMDRNETSTVTVNLRAIFDSLAGEEIRETTLDGNMALSSMNRFKFQPDGSKVTKVEYYPAQHTPLSAKKKDAKDKFNITLTPMQIRTFIIKWA